MPIAVMQARHEKTVPCLTDRAFSKALREAEQRINSIPFLHLHQ